MPSSVIIPRSLRPRPPSISSVLGSYNDADTFTPDETRPDETQSVINGMELAFRDHSGGKDGALCRSRMHRHPKALKAKSDAYVDYTNKTLGLEQTDFMIQQLEKKADPRLRQTYSNGHALTKVLNSAPVLRVGMTFLQGADQPQVNRSEQINMEGKEVDQKDALWRVKTAGSLLSHFTVSPDLQIIQTDQTACILTRAKYQARERDRDRQILDQRKAPARRNRDPDTVTIDSACVTIVKDLRIGDWDLRGLLVEVDWSSLWDLMVNYRNLIAGGGPEMTFKETETLLETMIDDARRLCVRSPILFRMSTRVRIINSENTRYGINHGPMFRTLTTSKGIKEIISLSASYYNSLDPHGSDDSTQKYIRPRFLQMVVLLLSLLNNEDLAELKDFLEATYKLKADRRDIELLILKVIPLLSINPRVFLNALVPTIEGFPLESRNPNTDEDHSEIWDIFIKRILEDGYILPGTVDDLGRRHRSWSVKWPENGFKSTAIFNTLQYAGRLRTINNIPPVEHHPGFNCAELTVVMTDDSKYVISPQDLDSINYMTPGRYPVQETAERKRFLDLVIEERPLDCELYQAIKVTNQIVHRVNQLLASPRQGGNVVTKIIRKRSDHQSFLNNVRGSGRLVKVFATLDQVVQAVTYKVDGRKVSREDAIQNMARDIRQLQALIGHIEQRGDMTDHSFFSAGTREVKESLDRVKTQINIAEQSRMTIGSDQNLTNEPIAKCLYPEGAKIDDGDVWFGYKAWCQTYDRRLQVEATKLTIGGVKWLTGEIIELSIHQQQSRLFVTPLKPVPEGYRHDEVRPGDVAVLLGQYVAVGEREDESSGPNAALSMINCLRIVSMEEQNQSRRGKNRVQESDAKVVCCFK